MPAGVQSQVNGVPAPAVAGDFASANFNRYSVLSGPGGLVAGSAGVRVGAFGWLSQQSLDPDNAATIVNSFGSGVPDGFVSRPDSPAVIVLYLADSTMLIQTGFPVPLHSGGDFWVVNNGSGQALVGQKAYAALGTGLVSFAATGSAATSSSTSATVAAGTWSATGSITGNVMTVGAVTGTYGVVVGSVVSGGASGTTVVAQLTGTAGAAGTYAVSIGEQAVASGTSLSGTFGVLTVGGTITGSIGVGALAAGSGIPTGSVVTTTATQNSAFTGAGGAGTYGTNLTGTGGSGTITFTTDVETKWIARSSGGAGELVKISEIAQ
jgi:hypothetical protein